MTLADAMQSGITPARVSYGEAFVNASRFIRELGPSAPRPRVASGCTALSEPANSAAGPQSAGDGGSATEHNRNAPEWL